MSDDEKKVPRVFVSYSHDDEEHKRKAVALTQALRLSFIDAEIDRFAEDDPPLDWANWMFQKLEKADFVIMICTHKYQLRVQDQEEPDEGRGARWEGAIISNAIYTTRRRAASSPFLPVIFKRSDSQYVPFFVAGSTHYLVDPESGEGIDWLVRRFKGQHQVTRVPLGGKPETEAAAPQRGSEMPTGAEFLAMAEKTEKRASDASTDDSLTRERRRQLAQAAASSPTGEPEPTFSNSTMKERKAERARQVEQDQRPSLTELRDQLI